MTKLLTLSCVLLGLMVIGCGTKSSEQPLASQMPFQLLDSYLTYLSETEREQFWSSVKQKGFQQTVSNIEVPGYWWSPVGGVYINTPKGSMTGDEYFLKYLPKACEVIGKLREISGNPFPTEKISPQTRLKTFG